jgi:metallo-beta-lactamase class B
MGVPLNRLRALVLVPLLIIPGALAQDAGAPPKTAATFPAPAKYPNEQPDLIAQHVSAARKLAGTDLFQDMAWRCIISPRFPNRVFGSQYAGKITPTKLFDNLYSVGQNAVSSHALVTSAGIILFDTLDNEDEARNLLVPNLIALGLNPADIKYIVISHEHPDHYGGARYLQKTYGARVIASAEAWSGMTALFESPSGPGSKLPIPDKDMEMGDGQSLTLGGTKVTFYLTPGHAKGVLSAIFPVTDHGEPHIAGYFGGTGGAPADIDLQRAQVATLERWAGIAEKAGVDVNITNHPMHSEALEKEELLRYRQPGDSNPFVLGKATYVRYVKVLEECGRVQLGMLGLDK